MILQSFENSLGFLNAIGLVNKSVRANVSLLSTCNNPK